MSTTDIHPTIRFDALRGEIFVLDQRPLPHRVEELRIASVGECAAAITTMAVRGAPLIGVAAAYGIWLAARAIDAEEDAGATMRRAAALLRATRPTAINLSWGVDRMMRIGEKTIADGVDRAGIAAALLAEAHRIAAEDAEMCRMIGVHGVETIRAIAERKGDVVNIITHCNAGRLACVAHGTATSPIYRAHAEGIPLHVWVDETRPRLQGASLTAFELREAGVPHTIIADGAAGHLMRRGAVDMAIVGCDRLTRSGDACNKIGTYMLALAARDNRIPFHVALPSSTIDRSIADGDAIPIEERSTDEVLSISGRTADGVVSIAIGPEGSAAYNPAFDVTPARLITAVITEEGIFSPAEIAGV